jgi:hypothetical protein
MAELSATRPVLDKTCFPTATHAIPSNSLYCDGYYPLNTASPSYRIPRQNQIIRSTASNPSSAPSSPLVANHDSSSQTSYISTPTSSLSLDDQQDDFDEVDDIEFPSLPSSSATTTDQCSALDEPYRTRSKVQVSESQCSKVTTVSERPAKVELIYQSIGDDTALLREPTRHVDYLSHDWCEEDIWRSWRHIVSHRQKFESHQRLENASWRTWAKSRNRLRTVSPEKLNWYGRARSTR